MNKQKKVKRKIKRWERKNRNLNSAERRIIEQKLLADMNDADNEEDYKQYLAARDEYFKTLRYTSVEHILNSLSDGPSGRSELLGALIDVVEDWLESKGITPADIPNDDRNDYINREDYDSEEEYQEACKELAIIFGNDYDELADGFAKVLGINRDSTDNNSTVDETDRIYMDNDEFAKFMRDVLVREDTILMDTGTSLNANWIIKNQLEERINAHPTIWKMLFKI